METEKVNTGETAPDKDFLDRVTTGLETMRPFFDFMTEALTTNLNGESTI